MYSATALWEFSILELWTKQCICCWTWLKKEGRVLPKAEYWPVCHNTGINPEFSVSRVPLQDEYCHKTVSESKWGAGFSLQTSGRVLQPAVYLQTQWSSVCPLLGLDLQQWGWSFPLYRGSPGWPALSAHFAECNGTFWMDTLSWWYNPFTTRPLLHSWLSCGSRMAIAAGRRQTPWLATASTWYEPRQENVEWGEKVNAVNLTCPPSQK